MLTIEQKRIFKQMADNFMDRYGYTVNRIEDKSELSDEQRADMKRIIERISGGMDNPDGDDERFQLKKNKNNYF